MTAHTGMQIRLLPPAFAAMESAMHSFSIKTVWWWRR